MEEVFGSHDGPDDPGQRAFDVLADTVRAAQAAGRIVADADPVAVAEMLWTSTHGIVSLELTCKAVLDTPVDALVSSMHATLLRGLTPSP